ncbi:MAG: DUF4019 domain-containing protein [Acidobacteriota bacterium]|nr:DUF4019 domain-containing protein [Acidobacteriota bacterium]
MADESCNLTLKCPEVDSYLRPTPFRLVCFVQLLYVLLLSLSAIACGLQTERRSIPAEVEAAINAVGEDIASERYEKIYHEASELWRQDASLEQSISAFKMLETKLGKVESRTVHSATEQYNSGGPLKGDAFIITYQTKFEKASGMETFTLVKRDNLWLLARYFVNSTALK